MTKVRVVLADDHRMLREGLRRSLEAEGLEVVGEAGDGDEAVALAEAERPDVVLMDVSMPGTDGIAATRSLRERHPDIPVVMLTMHGDSDVIARAIRAGARGYLVKDCSTREIVDTVRQAAAGGTVLSPGLAVSLLAAAEEEERRGASQPEHAISPREVEVLRAVADGLSPAEVAERLFISQKTVKNHLAAIYAKLDARDRTQAVLRAVRMGIIALD